MLVSTHAPGIEDEAERARRRQADGGWPTSWSAIPSRTSSSAGARQPLFAADPPEVGALARDDQRRNDPRALAAALRGLGTGEMEPLWDRLGELAMPVLVLVGERDEKFRALGERMAARLARGRQLLDRCPVGTACRSRTRPRGDGVGAARR